jgi:predicted nucleic acid-binding protein
MIVLDTNVFSETVKPRPSGAVLRWLARQDGVSVFTTAITQAEVLRGIEEMPTGKRRTRISMVIERIFTEEFQPRILPFDEKAARTLAKIVPAREAAGRPISQFDAMIAAIARSCHAAVATRNAEDFSLCGIAVVNPWTE